MNKVYAKNSVHQIILTLQLIALNLGVLVHLCFSRQIQL